MPFSFEGHNVFTARHEFVTMRSALRFRGLAELTDSLIGAGFNIEQVHGDWQRGPFVSTSPVMVFVARRS